MVDDVQSREIQVDEPKHVVRTYASDIAALAAAGKAGGEEVSLPEPAPEPVVEPRAEPAPAPELIPEAGQPAAAAAPSSPAPEEERMSILARLKARAGSYVAEEPAAPPSDVSRFSTIPTTFQQVSSAPPLSVEPSLPEPAYAAPEPEPAPPPAFVPEYRNPIPSITDYPQSAAPQAVSPLHTYTGDFAERISQQGASQFAVLAAEKDSRAAAPARMAPARHPVRNAFALVGGLILVLGGAGGVYYAYVSQKPQTVAVVPGVPSLIFADDRVAVQGSGTQLRQAILDAETKPLDAGQVRLTYLTIATTTAVGTEDIPQPGGALVTALMLPAPDILLRHVMPESTIGIVHAGDETRPFFILRVDSYDRSFAGVLEWEPTMAQDLSSFYPAYTAPAVTLPAATSTASTTVSTTPVAPSAASIPYAAQFRDEIVANHDVRVLLDATGQSVLLYGYRDQQTLIIARDEAAFTELLNRLAASKQ